MPSNPNVDGKITAEGEFTLYDSLFEKLKDILSIEQITKILLEDVAIGEWHDILNFDLSSIRVNKEIPILRPGNIVRPLSLDGTAQVRFDNIAAHSFDLIEHRPIKIDYGTLYLSNAAQAGMSLLLLIGKGDFQTPAQEITLQSLVQLAGLQGDTGAHAAVPVGAVPTLILAANASRKEWLIYDNGAEILYLGSSNGVTIANGIPIVPQRAASGRIYRGALWGIVAVGPCNTRRWEVT